ncbi:hypothetical protein BU17DRAFT_37819 [Hysterangium stoloniferum]|nr:hypothetical protein BU17DRAFT_37819 [Hysterangium stoloniferum]
MCGGPAWKREVVPDHKFDFIDVREFHSKAVLTRMKYLFLYGMILKSFLVYMSDIFSAVTMLSTEDWSNQIQKSCPPGSATGCVVIPFKVAKWLFVACIIFSFLLLAYEGRKAKKIIASRDISYAFTNVMSQNYYSLRSYDHFCLFCTISNSTKKKDDFAFFVFFTFKGWKRLLLADGPRQSINALTLYGFYLSKLHDGPVFKLSKYSDNFITSALIVATLFTVLVFVISLILLIAAGIFYVPLLCYIRGNLKEYCCHKVDKRIAELIKRKNKQRLAKEALLAKKEAAGDFSHLKNKQGKIVGTVLPQPTLPSVSLDDADHLNMAMRRGPYASSTPAPSWQSDYKNPSDYGSTLAPEYPDYPPPMPEYQPYTHLHPQSAYPSYGQSVGSLPQEEAYDKYEAESDYGSTAHLSTGAAPIAQQHHREYSQASPNNPPNPYSTKTSTPISDAYSGYVTQQTQAQLNDSRYGHHAETRGGYNYTSGYSN